MPQPKAPTNGYHNPLLQGSWKDKLPTPKPTQMPQPQQPKINHAMANLNIGFDHSNRLDFGSSRSMENTKPGDTSVCIICTQRRRGKRMKELYKDCIHDRLRITHKLKIIKSSALSAIAARTCMNKWKGRKNRQTQKCVPYATCSGKCWEVSYHHLNESTAITRPIISSGICTALVMIQPQCSRPKRLFRWVWAFQTQAMRIISMVLKRSSRLFNDVKHKKREISKESINTGRVPKGRLLCPWGYCSFKCETYRVHFSP